MLGKDLFKVESYVDLTNDSFKSLVLFYSPLIGADALYLYEFLLVKGSSASFEEVSKLLNSLLIPIERLELEIEKLNEYKLLKTLKASDEDKYIFVLNNPLTFNEFIQNNVLVRDFILKTSGEYYQSLLMNLRMPSKHEDFIDISKKLDLKVLENWTKENETFLKTKTNTVEYDFNTFFDVNKFLEDISINLLPIRFRTEDNMKELATLADLYNISYDKMRTYLPKVAKSDSNNFDLNLLRYLCENSVPEYKEIKDPTYDIPCELFLMNKQEGKEVTKYDKKIIYSLSHDYHLKANIINVVLETGLEKCDNSLIEKYLYAIASDLNRNNIDTVSKAKERLSKYEPKQRKYKKEVKPTYDSKNNPELDNTRFEEIMKKRGK